MMAGGTRRTRRQGRKRQQSDETPKMSISVDERSNSLIVAAPESLFEDVKQLVEMLDTVTPDTNDSVQVVTLHRSSTAIGGKGPKRTWRRKHSNYPHSRQPAAVIILHTNNTAKAEEARKISSAAAVRRRPTRRRTINMPNAAAERRR